jgi:hypothetical protein
MAKNSQSDTMIRQTIFTLGQVDVINWKRTDLDGYLQCAQELLNCEVGTTGLVKKRKGSIRLYNATGKAQFNSKMYEFVDNNGDYYLLLTANGVTYVFDTASEQAQVITNTNNNVVTNTGNNVVVHDNNLALVQTVSTPYLTSNLDNMDYTQDNDSVIFTTPTLKPGRVYISAYHSNAAPTFAFQYLNIYPYPAYDFNTINYNNFTVALSVAGDVLTFQFTGVGADPGFTSAWIGGQIIGEGASEAQPVGYAIITAVSYSGSGGGTVTFTGTVQLPFETMNPATIGSQYSVRQPAWSDTLGWPAKVLFFQNRLWLANTASLKNTIFGSRINAPINYDVGTGADTDAIIYTIGQTNSGAIQWINGGKQLEIYTQNYEFACPQDQNTGLTPSTFSIRQQSAYGVSSLLKPITYINDSYYTITNGKAIINFHFNGVGLTYISTNISAASQSLVKQPTNRALLRGTDVSQDNFIYFLNPDDDTITAFQFASEYKLAALTPYSFQENVQLIDITTINNVVYVLKYYSLTQQYMIEAFDDSTRMDCQITADMASSGLITGLDDFNGYTVQVVYNNQDFGTYLVVDGEITVDNPNEIADSVQVGQLYDVVITPMYLFAGKNAAPFFKQMSRIYVDYYNSLNFYINGKLVPYQTYAEIQAGMPLTPKTDTAIIAPVSGYDRFSTFSITQSSPFDLQILSIGYQISGAVI